MPPTRDSCLIHETDARRFLEYQDPDGVEVFVDELADCMLHAAFVLRGNRWVSRPASPIEVAQRRAKYLRLVQDIEEGLVILGEQSRGAKPVRRQPALWELWQTWETNTPLRIYCGEPREAPATVVAFLAHVKDITGSGQEIRDEQDERMDCAGGRCEELFTRNEWTSN